MSQNRTSASYESRQYTQHQSNAAHASMLSYHKQNQLTSASNESSRRVDGLRRLRRFQEQNSDERQQREIEEKIAMEEEREVKNQQDVAIAAAIAASEREKSAKAAAQRRLYEESDELKALKEKLKLAQLNAERSQQQKIQQEINKKQRERDDQMDVEIEKIRRQRDVGDSNEAEKRHLNNMKRREQLQQQMKEKEIQKQLEYEQYLKEKEFVDSQVASIAAEDERKADATRAKREELQGRISQYLRDRQQWRDQERKRAEDELSKIHEYQQLQDERYQQLLQQKQKKADIHDARLQAVAAEMAAKKKEQEEMENLLSELYAEEAESRALAEIQAREEKIRRMRSEMIAANEYQIGWKKQRDINQQKEEEQYRKLLMEKFAEDKKLDEMNKERKKREILNHREAVDKLVEAKRQAIADEIKKEVDDQLKEQKRKHVQLSMVEEERQKLLEEFSLYKDHLPKGVFKDEKEFELLFKQKPKQSTQGADWEGGTSKYGKKGSIDFRY